MCICSVYTPSRNSKSNTPDKGNYQQCLDQLEVISNTFSSTHAIFILGNMNASLYKRKGNNKDRLLEIFAESNSLYYGQIGAEIFFHPNK